MQEQVKEISDILAERSVHESDFHPINRHFLRPFLPHILKCDRNDFLLYNFDSSSILYCNYLMLCLPELWEDITADDLIEVIYQFKKTYSYFSIISFTYKFVEVDIIKLILNLPAVIPRAFNFWRVLQAAAIAQDRNTGKC